MTKIKKLERVVEAIYENGSQLSRLPNSEEMMFKINEIIVEVNEMKAIQEKNEPNPFAPSKPITPSRWVNRD